MKPFAGDASKLRLMNRLLILNALRGAEPAGLAELAAATGLSVATCANIVPGLVEEGAALELPERASRGGRPARRYAFNPEHFRVAAIAMKGTERRGVLAWTVANALGEPCSDGTTAGRRVGTGDVEALARRLADDNPTLRALAVSVPGVVRDGMIGICDIPDLAGYPIEERLSGLTGLAVTAENDMNLAALGYFERDAPPGTRGLVFAVFDHDACAGAGVVVNGRLLRGKSNFAGEVSFLPFGGGRNGGDRHRDPLKLRRYAGRIVASLAAVLNPDMVVLSGDAVDAQALPGIRRACLEFIPEEHVPTLAAQPDYDRPCRDGMIAAALSAASGGIRMMEE